MFVQDVNVCKTVRKKNFVIFEKFMKMENGCAQGAEGRVQSGIKKKKRVIRFYNKKYINILKNYTRRKL